MSSKDYVYIMGYGTAGGMTSFKMAAILDFSKIGIFQNIVGRECDLMRPNLTICCLLKISMLFPKNGNLIGLTSCHL